jgi:hypothetical protein
LLLIVLGVSSRLFRDRSGTLHVELTVPRAPGEFPGQRWRVLGNTFASGSTGVGFLEAKTGRRPEPQDRPKPRPEGRAGTTRREWPADYPDRARELHAQGLSCPKVAEELVVPFGTVKLWLWPDAQKRRRKPVGELEVHR